MSTLANFLRALVVDPRSQRAMEETLLDAREEKPAEGIVAYVTWAIRTAWATSRVLFFAGVSETQHFGAGALGLRVATTLLIPTSVLVALNFATLRSGPAMEHTARFLAMTPQMLAVWFPVGAWWLSIWPRRDRQMSMLFLAVGLLVAQVALVGWVVPEANQLYRTTIFDAICRQQPSDYCRNNPTLARGPAEQTFPELVRRQHLASTGEQRQLQMRLVICGLVPAVAILGGAVCRRSRWLRLTLTPVVVGAVWAALVSPGASSWILVALLVALGAAALARSASRYADVTV